MDITHERKELPDATSIHLAQQGLPSLSVGGSTGTPAGSCWQGCYARLEERASESALLFAHPTDRVTDMKHDSSVLVSTL